ncbi:MAG: dihydroorotase [Clostridia bacterium]|nr:dihydroorotase [Clostridia bacterium]
MNNTLKNALVYQNGKMQKMDFSFASADASFLGAECFQNRNIAVFPGFCDVHVHFREPGFSYKETIASGSAAAAAGGYTDVCTMPNLNPVPDSAEHLNQQLELIKKQATIGVHPYGAITIGQAGEALADLEGMAEGAIAFSDDGKGVQDEAMMRAAMIRAKALRKIIVAHCEDNSLLRGGYIHDGPYAKAHGHKGICSESEWGPIARDLKLAKEIGCAYHVCHISAKESVELIRRAKAEGVDVTCETAPHYLLMNDSMLQEDGRFKMNPPIREEADRQALVEGLIDGTIDMIATDHAPHSAEEKSRGLEKSLMGVVGLETAFPVLYCGLVQKGILPLERLIEAIAIRPRERFGLEWNEDYCVYDLDAEYKVEPEHFRSLGRATPFAGEKVVGKCLLTVRGGKVIYKSEE